MWVVSIADWPAPDVLIEKAVTSSGQARLDMWRADPADPRRIPPAGGSGVLFTSATFSLMNSGNRTLYAPKRSWKIDVEPGDDDDRIVGLARLNLKSMYNDPSQMREALAWDLLWTVVDGADIGVVDVAVLRKWKRPHRGVGGAVWSAG
jgi:hypothetical protein